MRSILSNSVLSDRAVRRYEPILIIDNEPDFSSVVTEIAGPSGFAVDNISSINQVITAFKNNDYNVILVSCKMFKSGHADFLKRIKRIKPHCQILYIIGWENDPEIIDHSSENIFGFIRKPVDPEYLVLMLRNAVAKANLLNDKICLLKSLRKQYELIGKSSQILKIRDLIDKAGSAGVNVLLQGEPGTGKKFIARLIHLKSNKAARPFMTIDAINNDPLLLETSIFGEITKSEKIKKGILSKLKEGTLYINEISRLNSVTQEKLLNFIENGKVDIAGGTIKYNNNSRIIAGTAHDLEMVLLSGEFRKDLYYRINIININLPPLRERKEDIPLLVDYFIDYFANVHGLEKISFSNDAMVMLQQHNWPGNVKELRGFAAKMVLLFAGSILKSYQVEKYL